VKVSDFGEAFDFFPGEVAWVEGVSIQSDKAHRDFIPGCELRIDC
jgi:hypothetical protein